MKITQQTQRRFRMKSSVSTLALALGVMLSASAAQAGVLYFDFNKNTIGAAANASVFLFGNAGQTATVSNLNGFSQNVVLGADGFFNLSISNTYQQSGTGVKDTGFQIVSPNPIAGYFVNRAGFSTDMTYLFDSAALGNNYVVASQGGSIGEGSQVMIHATQNNTAVTFTPTVGAPVNVVLNAGETYKYAGGGTNLTGSFVSADKPVAVFGGARMRPGASRHRLLRQPGRADDPDQQAVEKLRARCVPGRVARLDNQRPGTGDRNRERYRSQSGRRCRGHARCRRIL